MRFPIFSPTTRIPPSPARHGYPSNPSRPGGPAGLLATLVLGSLTAVCWGQDCYYEVTLLPGPECGPSVVGTQGNAIADNGWVVGEVGQCDLDGGENVLLYTGGQGFETLIPPLAGVYNAEGRGVCSTGRIVGVMDIDGEGQRGFIYDDATGWTKLDPPPGGPHSGAFSISESGQYICGYRSDSSGFWRATLWEGQVATEIPTTLGPRSIANDVNEQGDVVGWMGTSLGIDSHPYLFHEGKVIDLGLLPRGLHATALAVNSSQVVVGSADVPSWEGTGRAAHAFIHSNGVLQDIKGLPGFRYSGGWDVNNANTVVGFSAGTLESINERKAFLWEDGIMTALEDLVDPSLGLEFLEAYSINDDGQIVALGAGGELKATSAVILTPPNPADIDGDCIAGVSDLLMLLAEWGMSSSPADLDNNGIVDVVDLLFLLGHWG